MVYRFRMQTEEEGKMTLEKYTHLTHTAQLAIERTSVPVKSHGTARDPSATALTSVKERCEKCGPDLDAPPSPSQGMGWAGWAGGWAVHWRMDGCLGVYRPETRTICERSLIGRTRVKEKLQERLQESQ